MVHTKPHLFLSNIFPNTFVKVLKLCGMLPYNDSLRVDWRLTVYSVLLIFICLFVKATTITVVHYSEKVNVDNANRAFIISRFVKIVYPIIKSLIPFVALLNALCKCKYLYQFCSYLCKSDELVDRRELSLLGEKQMKLATKLIMLCLCMSLSAMLCSVVLQGPSDRLVLLWITLLYWIDTVGFVSEIQFVLMSLALWTRFVHVNNKLEHMFLEEDSKAEVRIQSFADVWGSKMNIQERVDNSRGIGRMHTSTKTPGFLLASDFFSKECPLSLLDKAEDDERLDCVRLLRLRHRYLCAALLRLNLLFEHVLLVSVFSLFLMILLNIYFAIFALSHLLDICFSLLFSFLRVVCPLVVTDSLVHQARRALELLSTFAARDSSISYLKELQEFGREVECRKLTVTCAFNLFTVKTELLTAAVAAGTTYIVTLIQLH